MPRLSIITINLNNLPGLQQTFESVFIQAFNGWEYIVIDGGSTDGSKELIEKNSGKLAYWTSEKDTGIYNAMNKGIAKAKGEYLLFLNSGDYLYNLEVLNIMVKEGDAVDIIFGNVILEKNDKRSEWNLPDILSFEFFMNSSLPHAASLIRRSLFEQTGLYNETLKIVSDWEFFLLAVHKFQCSYKHLPFICAVFNQDGISANNENRQLMNEENARVLKKYFGSFLVEFAQKKKAEKELHDIKTKFIFRVIRKLKGIFVAIVVLNFY